MLRNRLIAGVLSAVMCTSAVLPNQAFNNAGREANAATTKEKPISGDFDIKSTNSLGNLLKQAAAKDEAQNPLAEKACNSQFQITALEFDSETGTVRVSSPQHTEAKIVVSFINDETSENVLSVETTVEAGELVNSELKIDASKLPQYYIVKAQLFDALNRPVGTSYTLSRYTKEIQEIIATDINDFDEEQVVNLDEDDTTNFLVLNDDTVKAESSEEQNTLVSADYDNNVFVFENADETVASLQEGELFFIQPDDDNIIAVNVENVEKDGDKVTVSGNDEDIEDAFEFIKIEGNGELSKAKIDTSTADEGVSFPNVDENGDVVINEDGSFDFEYEEPRNEAKYDVKISKTFSLDSILDPQTGDTRPNDPYYDGSVKRADKTSGSLTISLNFNFYKKFTTTNIEVTVKITPTLTITDGFSGSGFYESSSARNRSLSASIATILIPLSVPGTVVEVNPRVFVEFSGKITLTIKWDNIFGYINKNGKVEKPVQLFNEKNIDASLKITGEVYAGLELQIYFEVVSKHIAAIGIDAKAGLRVRAEADLGKIYEQYEKNMNEPPDKVIESGEGDWYHACKFCIKASTDFVVKVNLDLCVLRKKNTINLLELSINLPFLNLYFSSENGFGIGECDYNRFRATFNVISSSDGGYIPGAVVKLDDKEKTIGGSGNATFYCLPGTYSYSVTHNGKNLGSGQIVIKNSPIDKTIEADVKLDDKGNPDGYVPGIKHPDVTGAPVTKATTTKRVIVTGTLPALSSDKDEVIAETGSLGEHISYMLYPDGYLYACGYGDMYDFGSSPFRDPSIIKYVVIENTGDEEDGGIITSIGNNVFVNCSNMESVNLPQSIKRIGKNAFKNCSSFSTVSYDVYDYVQEKMVEIRYPEGKLVMPEAVTAIEDAAFCNCTLFNDIVIPKTVPEIGSYAFSGTSITEIEVPDTVKKIGDYVFSDCTSLKKAVIKNCADGMGNHIFSGCAAIEDITIPYMGHSLAAANEDGSTQQFSDFFLNGNKEEYNVITNYGGWTRYIPKSLNSVTVTGGTRIPNYAFYRIGSVKNISVPKTIKSFGNYSFADCVSLENGYMPEGVVSIGNYAFSNCGSAAFKTVSFPTTLTSIGNYAFSGCKGLTGITVPKNVKTIGEFAFNDCSAIKYAVIEGGADGIGSHIFSGCKSIAELTLPFAGFDAKSTDDAKVTSQISTYFLNGNEKEYYAITNYGGWTRYIPNALKKINITGGKRISNYAFYRLSGVESIVIPKSITEIGHYAFADCTSITNGYIPEGVTSIGNYAFSNCGNAEFNEVKFPTTLKSIGNYAFSGCVGLTSITVPKTVTTIGEFAFNNCSSITSAVIYGGADGIGSHIFSGCKSIAELTLPFAGFDEESSDDAKVTSQISTYFLNGNEKDYYAITNYGGWTRYIPNVLKKITILGGTRISNYAFYRLSGVESIVIPETITEIGHYAFAGCTSFKNAFIPKGITSIGDYAFSDCGKAAFGDVDFPTTLKSIGKYAFNNCKGLGDIVIPDSVNTIGEFAFNECSSIEKAVIDGGAGGIGLHIFSGCKSIAELSLPFAGLDPKSADDPEVTSQISSYFLNGNDKEYYVITNYGGWTRYIPRALKKITIKDGTRISNYAFYRLNGVESITIPSSIVAIGDHAFDGCLSLTDGYIPEGVTSIGNYSFNNCSSALFKDVKFPTTLTKIGEYAFSGCVGLTSITVPKTVKTIGAYAFNNCSSLKTAVIYGGEDGIGVHIFSGCKSIAELTLPFAGSSLAAVNAEDSKEQVSTYFLNGDTTDYYTISNYGGWTRYIPRSLKKITILGGKKIPNYAFYRLTGVKEIIIPDDISYIGTCAFAECSELKSAPLTNVLTEIGDNAFNGCRLAEFKSVTFPDTLTSIGAQAFADCDGLTDITVPDSVQKIGDYAFVKCDNLVKADIYGGANSIGNHIFSECSTIESMTIPYAGFSLKDVDAEGSTQQISGYFLNGNDKDYYVISNYGGWTRYIPKSLKTVTVLGGKRIPNYAFYRMNGLEKINVPDDITTIGVSAFEGCTSLKNSVIKDTLTSVGDRAFVNCSDADFKDVKFSDSLESIGKNAFSNCDGLLSVVIPENVNSIGDYAFENCNSLKSADIAGDDKVIGLHIFSDCDSIESISLPFAGFDIASVNKDGSTQQLSDLFLNGNKEEYFTVTNYGGWTRYIPKSLNTITVDGGKRIPKYAFYKMLGIEDVYLPKELTNIADNAFNGCDGIENVYYPSTREDWEKNVTIGVNNEAIDGKVRFLGEDYTTTSTTTTTGTSTTTTTSATTTSKTTTSTSKTTTSATTTSKTT
ncbi:leucine-rich repeat domain-containing protein, partial [Ruminococcus flavefaciens]|uniref:leucine-rich repeat domain-containing protein n=1 Tax=Ruminococcus flavefaciens TaxID=1265 RepID=UPI0005619741